MNIAEMMMAPTGHEAKGLTNKQWECKRLGLDNHSNGRIPFSIPKRHHKRVADDYAKAKDNRTVTALYIALGKEFGKNGGEGYSRGVKDCTKAIVVAQGGEV